MSNDCQHPDHARHHALKLVDGQQTNIVQDICRACGAVLNETEDHQLDFMVRGDRYG